MMSEGGLQKRKLPKLMACMTKSSLENMRNRALFFMDSLDAKGIRRRKLPLHECLILELQESGYQESSVYIQDLIYDNIQILAEDDIGIVVDLRKQPEYLEHICAGLVQAEKHRDKGNTKQECLCLLGLAMHYAEEGKGILWLAEKFYLASLAVSSQYMVDGGRQKACCKFRYGKFLLDKFPGADPDEPFQILAEVRDSSIGKDWSLEEVQMEGDKDSLETVFAASAIQLHRVLLNKARMIRKQDTAKAERLSRLAERRALDADDIKKTAEAIIEIGICQLMMDNLNNAQKTFERALKIYTNSGNIEGLCETRMHLAAVMQKLGDYDTAAKLLTQMGALAMENSLRRQLGRALQLLGELHLRRERPELGTQHLAEAFTCFIGTSYSSTQINVVVRAESQDAGEFIYTHKANEIYEEEAEQARLMMAVSAGQELMASYFNLLREAGWCTVAQTKVIEWKLSHSGWWNKKKSHDLVPCMCPEHNRTPLDVLRFQQLSKESEGVYTDATSDNNLMTLQRTDTVDDMRRLRSSFQGGSKFQVKEHKSS